MTSRRIYQSSNGDIWDLVRDGERVVVRHIPNLASGGSPSTIDLDAFLAKDRHSAQTIALTRMIGTLVEDA